MIVESTGHELVMTPSEHSAFFGISWEDEAHVMNILRNTLYSNKERAVLREYMMNAWDAHQEVGKGHLPIVVTLPTKMNPVLVIRDYGPGMTMDKMFNTFLRYGASSKRGTNSEAGMMGIGGKAAFCYTDAFTVTSWNGGTKSVYMMNIDLTDKGTGTLLAQDVCGDETGIEIQVPIQPRDIKQFETEALDLASYFTPTPQGLAPKKKEGRFLPSGLVCKGEGRWIAVMGCAPYPIDTSRLQKPLEDAGARIFTDNRGGEIHFAIGALGIAASREGLKYSHETIKALVEGFQKLAAEYVAVQVKGLEELKPWGRRLRIVKLVHTLGLDVPGDCWQYAAKEVPLPPNSYMFGHGNGIRLETIPVMQYGVIHFGTQTPGQSRYRNRYRVRLSTKVDVDTFIKESFLEGLAYTKQDKSERMPTAKGNCKTYGYLHTFDMATREWQPVNTEIQEDAIIIPLGAKRRPLKEIPMYDFCKVWEVLGLKMPQVLGWSTLKNKPPLPANAGIDNAVLRLSQQMSPADMNILVGSVQSGLSHISGFLKKLPVIENALGPSHIVTLTLRQFEKAWSFKSPSLRGFYEWARYQYKDLWVSTAFQDWKQLSEWYPLLVEGVTGYGYDRVVDYLEERLQYVKWVDEYRDPKKAPKGNDK